MRRLFNSKTGKMVNNGDVINVNGTNITITDLNIPSLVAANILTFDGPDTSVRETPQKECVSKCDKGPKKLTLLQTLVTSWGEKHDVFNKKELNHLAELVFKVAPIGFVGVLLKEAAERFNIYDEVLNTMYGFDITTGQIVEINTEHMKYPYNVALFENREVLKAVLSELSDIIESTKVCPNE